MNYGMLVLWITLNPSDLKNKLVLTLAGMRLDINQESIITANIHSAMATMNLIAVAQLFEVTCSAIFNNLLQSNSLDRGLFGPISTYFSIVETNDQNMLYLHCLVWLRDASHFSKL